MLLSIEHHTLLYFSQFNCSHSVTVLAVIVSIENTKAAQCLLAFYDKRVHYYCAHLQPQLNLEAVLSWLYRACDFLQGLNPINHYDPLTS